MGEVTRKSNISAGKVLLGISFLMAGMALFQKEEFFDASARRDDLIMQQGNAQLSLANLTATNDTVLVKVDFKKVAQDLAAEKKNHHETYIGRKEGQWAGGGLIAIVSTAILLANRKPKEAAPLGPTPV